MEISSQTEQKIIEAATTVFSEKGKDGARMQEIADMAGTNKALLHYYFRSKNKLFRIVFIYQFKRLITSIFSAIDDDDNFYNFIHTFVTRYIQYIKNRKSLLRFIIWEIGKEDPEMFSHVRSAFLEQGYADNPIIQKTKSAIESGQIKDIDPVHFTVSLLGMCVFPFITYPFIGKVIPGADINNPQFVDKRADEIVSMIWNGIRADQ
jgi:AcrR family transcriptional regulator